MSEQHYLLLDPGQCSWDDLNQLHHNKIKLSDDTYQKIKQARLCLEKLIGRGDIIYGVNTGFGKLAEKRIAEADIMSLQRNLIHSHAVGVGPLLDSDIVKLILLLKINSLGQGFSGVSCEVVDTLIGFYNHEIIPHIPAKGSVGASGDLAPLAHLSLALLGEGQVYYRGEEMSAAQAMQHTKLLPIDLSAKTGLALVNGLQVSTAIALKYCWQIEHVFAAALCAGGLSTEAVRASIEPFDARIHNAHPVPEQIACAVRLRDWLADSQVTRQARVQDPYSIRCQAQVMGACLRQIEHAKESLLIETNAVSDNPLIFADDEEILHGGNFHGEMIAMAADQLALALAEIASLSERRIALLIDEHMSGLPAFLSENSGLNSGFMLAHVTAAALTSENKRLAHPASVDSIPSSANQEDHVSMATQAAYRLGDMLENTATVIAIELLAATQGVEFHLPEKTSPKLQRVMADIRQHVPRLDADRVMAGEINGLKERVLTGGTSLHSQ